MPVHCPIRIERLDREAFGKLDYQIMSHAFACHSALGRLADEFVYQIHFANRLQQAGFQTALEVPVTATYKTFCKPYSLDLVVNNQIVYELKAIAKLAEQHVGQLINYLMLLGLEHGKLVNFRPNSVEARFVNVAVTSEIRRSFAVSDTNWQGTNDFRDLVIAILREWGTGLEISLYYQAIVDQLGGEALVMNMLPMIRNGKPIGNQRFSLVDPHSAFRLTAFSGNFAPYLRQLELLLVPSPLDRIHHVNIDINHVTFSTVAR